ncbi:MAG: IS256 family transposase [Saprospirales bacterium]|jgi:transposase-like protein|nr:IS256 family transposase [Saprospirales bacterium]
MAKKQKKETLEDLIPDAELRDRIVKHLYSKEPLLKEGSVFSELLQAMVNKMLEGEVSDFLEEERSSGQMNKRNGYTEKQVLSSVGPLSIRTPRDRNGDFEPELIEKRQRELSSGLDDQILALYAQGNSVEDVRRLLAKLYGISISAGKISAITDKVLPEIQAWRSRSLRRLYAVIYLDAVCFNVRNGGKYSSRAFYTVYGIDAEGQRDLLGLYISENEGASHWGLVLEDLKERGVEDVLIFCTDDLTGFSEAISEVYPLSVIQKCIVHKVRSSTRFVDDKDVKSLRKDLRTVYTALNREAAQTAMEAFKVSWGGKYGRLVDSWEADWEELMAFMDYPKELRRMIYTTNPVEALHRIIRKLIKGKAAWVSDTALIKQIYLSLMYNEKSWKRSAFGWKAIQRELVDIYGERFSRHLMEA